jgi:hypothetical protein
MSVDQVNRDARAEKVGSEQAEAFIHIRGV